jgi:hypothetical protein
MLAGSRRRGASAAGKVQREQFDAWLAAPKSDVQKRLDEAADRALEHPTDELKAALNALDLKPIENQAGLCSNDSDFARFQGLRWENPLL